MLMREYQTMALTVWPEGSVLLEDSGADLSQISARVAARVFRKALDAPGFGIIEIPGAIDSRFLRHLMVELRRDLSGFHHRLCGQPLKFLSLGRFDQQKTTRFHLDGGPDQSFLLLGYEASDVGSVIQFADFTRCARDLGISPKEFLSQHNPMFDGGQKMLRGYEYSCQGGGPRSRIVVINNSCDSGGNGEILSGVLHRAVIPTPEAGKRRIINSALMAPMVHGEGGPGSDR